MATIPKYVSQGSFDIEPERWADAKEEIRSVLIEAAQERKMITYSDLVGRVNAVAFNAFDQRLFAILGQISTEEHECGRPLLSVLVVHKVGDMKPGDGFFELAEALGHGSSDVLKVWITEVQKVYQYWNK